MALAAALLLTTMALGAVVYLQRAPEDVRLLRFTVSPPEGASLALTTNPTGGASLAPMTVSPDGRRLALVIRGSDGKQLLSIRALDSLTAQVLPGTEGASSPFWSPDSRFLGFAADGKLKKIEVSGGPPVTLCDAPTSFGGTWNQDGVIVFSIGGGGLQKVSAAGGVPSAVATGMKSEALWRPSFLPDGRHFLYRVTPPSPGGPIYIGSLDSSDRTKLLDADSTNVVYSQEHILFLREKALMAQPFDVRRLTFTGEPFPVAEQVQTLATNPTGVFSVSGNGVLAEAGSANRDIWLFDLLRGLRTKFTFDPADELSSVWSPDSSRLVFNSRRKGHLDLYQKASSGAGGEELLLADGQDKSPVSWSPDGRHLLYASTGGDGNFDLWILPLTGDKKPFPFLKTPFNEVPGVFSPDGRWIAYASNESGPPNVFVAPFPGPGGKWLVSPAGGNAPKWSRDGKELFFVTLGGNQQLMAASVNGTGPTFQVGEVKPLFSVPPGGARSFYDVSPDGRRFLVLTAQQQRAGTASPVTVVVNWAAGLKK